MGDGVNPWHNLAVEALLFDALAPDEAVFYLWQNQNTVVIGRHQNAWQECRVQLLEAEGGRLARRSSGGGAVFHDLGNLNFSYILPRAACDTARQLAVIRAALARFGIRSEFTGRNDLVAADNGAKFSGSAYRYTREVGLHHGTLLVSADLSRLGRYLSPGDDKLRAKGIRSVRQRVCNLNELCPSLEIAALSEALKDAFTAEYGPAETLDAAALNGAPLAALESQYASWAFRFGRAMPFDATLTHRFDWGGVTLALSLKAGRVSDAQVYSDAMDEAMIGAIAPALIGARYDGGALAEALGGISGAQAAELSAWLRAEALDS